VVADYVQDNSPNAENRVKIRITPSDGGLEVGHSGSTTATIRTTPASSSIGLGGMSGSTTGTIRMQAAPDSSVAAFEHGDMAHPSVVRLESKSGSGGIRLGGMSGSTTGTIRMQATPDSVISVTGTDLDGDGVMEGSMRGVVTPAAPGTTNISAMYLDVDDDDDGVPESSMEQKCGFNDGRYILRSGISGSTTGTIRMQATPDSAVSVLGSDSDGDGLSERSIQARAGEFVASTIVEYKDGDDPLTHKRTVSQSASASGAATLLADDLDGDGVPESYLENKTTPGSSSSILHGMSGSTTGTIRMQATPDSTVGEWVQDNSPNSESRVRLKLGPQNSGIEAAGLGGSTTGTIRMQASPDSAVSIIQHDSDNDGVANMSGENYCDASTIRYTLSDSEGDPASIEMSIDNNEPPQVLIQVIGTDRCLVKPDSGVQLYNSSGVKTADLDDDGDGYLSSSLKIGTTSGTNHIDVVGGANCDGTNWNNASDAASKDNFRSVDGAELLEKLMELEITRWNYKGKSGADHIGPTAQDFKAAFGLGSDDKTISTVDPAGIALAAIKELSKQNRLLTEKNDELTQRLDDLQKKIDRLLLNK
jgi:hypothetical protein